MDQRKKEITILGSTGSIGTQSLDVISRHPEDYIVRILTGGRNWELLARQALEYHPEHVVIMDEHGYSQLKEALSGTDIEVHQGEKAIESAAGHYDHDIVIGALVGYSGLRPTLRALEKGKTVALANKETLVAGGPIVTETCRRCNAAIIPVDSEHSAIFQCLRSEQHRDVHKLILTASGGPFRTTPASLMHDITPEKALDHPNWKMGAKVTIDSASMMNKGFEMIEARWLFDIFPDDIEVLVHPQSVVHSMVEFIDGSVKAQLGIPDMRLPISYALGYPERLEMRLPRLDLTAYGSLTFEKPDIDKFPLLGMAYRAISTGGTAPAILNAANEICVAAFLNYKIRFTDMPRIINETLDNIPAQPIGSYDDIVAVHEEASRFAGTLSDKFSIK